MIQRTGMTTEPQRLRALERANEVRLARAELKRRIADGQVSAADVILACPWEAASWSVGDLLMSQRRWGTTRCRKFLGRHQISEIKALSTLTERQRRVLAAELYSTLQLAARIEQMPEQPVALEHRVASFHTVPERRLALVGA